MSASIDLPVESVVECQSNPRRAFDTDALAELAESVRAHGILQPILVRPGKGTTFELVAGHRRLRAAVAAGLDHVPVIVRELDDKQVLEIQVIENLQRTDLHPLEEAEGYRRLHQEFGYSVEDLAAKVGKSKAYVYSRMRYTHLPPNAKKLFLEGSLTPSTAGLIARIPDATLAERAAKEITQGSWGDGIMTAHEAREHIERNFTLRLTEAQWSIKDAELLPAAGACTTCPKRTGNQRELFDDIKSPDVCTDPQCYQSKTDAHWLVKQAEAKAKGQEVLDAAAAAKVFDQWGNLKHDARYVDLSGYTRSGHPVKKVKPKDAPTVLARDPKYGLVLTLVAVEHLPKSASKAGPAPSARAEDAKRKLKRLVAAAAIEKIKAQRSKLKDEREWWTWLVSAIAREFQHDGLKAYAKQQGLDITKASPQEAVLRHLAALKTVLELQEALSDLVLAQAGNIGSYMQGYGDVLETAATAFRIDLKAIEKSVRASKPAKAKSKSKKKPATKPKPTKKGRAS